MKYVIRIKAVSSCMRIRRSALCYLMDLDNTYDLSRLIHPLKKFKSLTVKDSCIIVDGKKEALSLGEEVYFYKNNNVDTGSSIEVEQLVLGAMLLPLDKDMEEYYQKKIDEGISFDEWKGEFEYLIGLMYELDLHDVINASLWYEKAKEKKFPFYILSVNEEEVI